MVKKETKKKEPFNPFARMCQSTTVGPVVAKDASAGETKVGEISETAFLVTPNLPKANCGIRVQFRCTVRISENDLITIYMPGFKGPARLFTLSPQPTQDGVVLANCFLAYWSGEEKRKGAGKNGVPPKQTLQLRCVQSVDAGMLVNFFVPMSLGLTAPDKLATNSSKIKVEARLRCAEGGRVQKQSFLVSSEVKKRPIAEELELYDQLIERTVEAGGLGRAEREAGEAITREESDQLTAAALTPRGYPYALQWVISPRVFHSYEDAGGFIKRVMENTVGVLKRGDAMALHREVATNWGVKVGAVALLEEVLSTRCRSLYPHLSRGGLLAAYLLTLEPVDVGRLFTISALPQHSLLRELQSAFRTSGMLAGDPVGGAGNVALECRTAKLLRKWANVIAALLTVTSPVEEGSGGGGGMADSSTDAPPRPTSSGSSNGGRRVTFDERSNATFYGSVTRLRRPPPLYVGLRDVSSEEQEYLRGLAFDDCYMFPSFTLARQVCPLPPSPAAQAEAAAAAAEGAAPKTITGLLKAMGGGGNGAAAAESEAAAAEEENNDAAASSNGDDDDDAEPNAADIQLPEGAVVFELRNIAEALELCDISAYPHSREWLLPFCSSFRVASVTVRADLNDALHVVLEMVGSLAGGVVDDLIPEGDRNVAGMVANKVRLAHEQADALLPSVSQLVQLVIKRLERRQLHPPTLMRATYLAQYEEVKRASEAKQVVEAGTVLWQVCTHAAQTLEEGVVKPSSWELLPRKYLIPTEHFFLGRHRDRMVLEDNGFVLNLNDFTVDYGGRGPRPVRRMIGRNITHSQPPPHTMEELVARNEELSKQMATLNAKLGLNPDGSPMAASAVPVAKKKKK